MALTKKDLDEALKKAFKEFKVEFKAELKAELKAEFKAELKAELKPIRNYIKRTSDNYEHQTTDVLVERLHSVWFGQCDIQKLHLREIIQRNGKLLTDLDGCVFVKQRPMKNVANSTNTFEISLQNKQRSRHITGGMPTPLLNNQEYLYVVESKNSFSKTEIDKKIAQMMKFERLLKSIKNQMNILQNTQDANNATETSNNFEIFVQNNQDELTIIPSKIKELYFAVPYLSREVEQYIRLLNEGITNSQYEKSTYEQFMADKDSYTLVNILHNQFRTEHIHDYGSLVVALKTAIQKLNTHPKLLEHEKDLQFSLNFCKPLTTAVAQWCKGKIGTIIQEKIRQTNLSPIPSVQTT